MFTKSNAYTYPHTSPRAAAAGEFLHHQEMLAAAQHFSSAASQELCSALGGGGEGFPAAGKAAAGKKDRHSKIETAQGPRDRRVRLSIGVARKFFDLQENLGFDKPSKTLDWLLTNSKTAIKDLEEMREAAAAAGESEADSGEKAAAGGKMKAAAAAKEASPTSLAKESRAKARARARERTREKMCIKRLTESRSGGSIGGGGDFTSIQFMNNQLKMAAAAAAAGGNVNLGFHPYEGSNHEDLIQESIVIKRKVKNHPLGFHQNLIISSSNYGLPPPYNNAAAAAENWDNICAILDQHKFINSTSNN